MCVALLNTTAYTYPLPSLSYPLPLFFIHILTHFLDRHLTLPFTYFPLPSLSSSYLTRIHTPHTYLDRSVVFAWCGVHLFDDSAVGFQDIVPPQRHLRRQHLIFLHLLGGNSVFVEFLNSTVHMYSLDIKDKK